ncbi:PE family protein, partial [Mycobacterium sp. UM_CSW]|uniref:PE family protein n=1 Tax=Mycobacterium sp. UM_CSW TaxID=1370119 RepID=UPI001268F512
MSFVIVGPEALGAAASDLARIGAAVNTANAAAAASTTRVVAAGADEVSAAIASLFSGQAQDFHALTTRAAAVHDQFVQALGGGAASYASAEAANVQQTLMNAINAPTEALFGRPLVGNGANGAPGTGQNGGDAGILIGNGGAGGSGGPSHPNGGNGGAAG